MPAEARVAGGLRAVELLADRLLVQPARREHRQHRPLRPGGRADPIDREADVRRAVRHPVLVGGVRVN